LQSFLQASDSVITEAILVLALGRRRCQRVAQGIQGGDVPGRLGNFTLP